MVALVRYKGELLELYGLQNAYLQSICRDLKVTGFSRMNRHEMIEQILLKLRTK
jgi:hypothetical protein